MSQEIDRRRFLRAAGLVGVVAAFPLRAVGQGEEEPPDAAPESAPQPQQAAAAAAHAHAAPQPTDRPADSALVFFTARESAFVTAAVDRLVPSDETGPGAVQAGVVPYLDRQLAGAFGSGHGLYLAGPWPDGALPTQGYQLPLTPAQLYRLAIAEIDSAVAKANQGKGFAQLGEQQQEAVLQALDTGEMKLESVPGKVFFDLLLANTAEGYFADPAYGGNRDLDGWRMLDFPGARGDYADDIVLYRNKPYGEPPVKLADLQ
jgi:gluconate 2-dehydrogenase gamma chain